MKVKATAKGFYIGPRNPGDLFEMPESAMKKKDGKPVLPSWVAAVVEPKGAKAAKEGQEGAKAAKEGQEGDLV